jgi:Protein of unknown function (DUF2752)
VRWRRPNREERQLAVVWGVAGAGALALRPLWLALVPLLPPCPFRALTGIPCPSCGTTHAAIALLNGRVGAALAANPFATVAGALFLAGAVLAPLWAAVPGPMIEIPHPLPGPLRIAIVAALGMSWAWVIWHG